MKDPHDTETLNILTGEKTMKYQVNYKYAAPNNKMRTAALILDAEDHTTVVKMATEQLKRELSWFKITGTIAFSEKK